MTSYREFCKKQCEFDEMREEEFFRLKEEFGLSYRVIADFIMQNPTNLNGLFSYLLICKYVNNMGVNSKQIKALLKSFREYLLSGGEMYPVNYSRYIPRQSGKSNQFLRIRMIVFDLSMKIKHLHLPKCWGM